MADEDPWADLEESVDSPQSPSNMDDWEDIVNEALASSSSTISLFPLMYCLKAGKTPTSTLPNWEQLRHHIDGNAQLMESVGAETDKKVTTA